MEHRWGERFSVDLPVRIAARPFAARAGRLVDLSLSGGGVQTGFELRVLSRVQIALVLPQGFAPATPTISAYVARSYPGGIGVEWCEFAPRQVVELLRAAARRRDERRICTALATEDGHSLRHGT